MALPLAACAAVLLLTQPMIARVVDQLASADLSVFSDDKINEIEQNLQIAEADDENAKEIPSSLAVTTSLPNDALSSDDEILSDLLVNDAKSDAEKRQNDASKLTYFVDGKEYNGSISDIDPATIASMQIVKNDPAYPDSKVMITTKSAASSNEKVKTGADKIAQFKGGESELLAFLIENIKYPSSETQSSDETIRVILSFNILPDGNVDDIIVRKSGGEAFDTEAIEVLKKTSGRWDPAEENGKPVVSQFTIPIIFKKKT